MVQAREEGYQTLSLSVAVHNRSRMMYQRVGFEKVGEEGESWTMLLISIAGPPPTMFLLQRHSSSAASVRTCRQRRAT